VAEKDGPVATKPKPKRGGRRAITSQKRGPTAFIVSDDQRHIARVMASNGNPLPVIARALKCSVSTLSRHFRTELTHGREDIKAAMEVSLVKAGLSGNVGAIRLWLLRHDLEWRAAIKEVREADNTPMQENASPVRFYLPANGRDGPEHIPEAQGPVIEAEIEAPPANEVPQDETQAA
jgi:hypothetical protein